MEKDSQQPSEPENKRPILGNNLLVFALLLIAVATLVLLNQGERRSLLSMSKFKEELTRGNIESFEFGSEKILGKFVHPPVVEDPKSKNVKKGTRLEDHFAVNFKQENYALRQELENIADEQGDVIYGDASPNYGGRIMYYIWPLILLGLVVLVMFYFLRRTRSDLMGGGFLSGFSKSPAKRFDGSDQAVTFDDVAGLEGVKADLQEIVDYLKDPEKFQRLGGRVPKGVLLNGPPGTGKTLLARAVAGEAEVPYFSVSGSEFIQMFVGVGASRVRDLFGNAMENSPAIIFIDEIDAVGRQRGTGMGGGHDEREQTLNQILSEMDGFSPSEAVIVIAATNRPDVLDPALLRPGRFDRHITVGRPTLKGREAIFKVHVRDVPLGDDVDLHRMAAGSVGMTGADIRNMVNEAALWAARHDKKSVDQSDFEYARDKILMGAKREEVLQEDEKEKTAYHEAGHTLTAWHLEGADLVHKVTIIPRGRALGVTQYVPQEDRMSVSRRELEHHLIVLLGGRAAEKIIYGETTAGAENDLERATSIARRMVTAWGMSEKLGPVSYKTSDSDPFLGREIHQQRQFSEHTQELIDEEVARILHEADRDAEQLLSDHRDDLEKITRGLMEQEELSEKDLVELIGESTQHKNKKQAEAESQAASESSAQSSSEDEETAATVS